MIRRGTSPDGVPIYSEDDPVDFLWRWLRVCWPWVLSGRFFDNTGETAGWWLCAVTNVSKPTEPTLEDGRSRAVHITANLPIEVLAHTCNEDSNLNPLQVFRLSPLQCVLSIEAELKCHEGAFEVLAFRSRRTSRDAEGVAARYGGGNFGFHTWP